MNRSKHLKRNRLLIQLGDGSSTCLFSSMSRKELLVEADMRSNIRPFGEVDTPKIFVGKCKKMVYFDKLFVKIN